jgi:two-component system chemotaxis response regulator CheY
MLRQKILIIDDERPLCELLLEALCLNGPYQVDHAPNGKEGYEKYKAFHPDLVVMDIHMPQMDGYESSRRIKAFDPCAKILVVTGNATDVRARQAVKEGIVLKLLQKPIRLKELSRVIEDSLTFT